MKKVLEICCYTLEAALLAEEAGADRIELCDNYAEGGTTPSMGTLRVAQEALTIPIMVIIRPRGGDFLYTRLEYESMKHDVIAIQQLTSLGNSNIIGIVVGFLLQDGRVDLERTREIVDLAHPMEVTFHRAFDMCRDPLEVLEDLRACGVKRVLTSGGKNTAVEGIDLIQKLVEKAGSDIIIMPGSGVRDTNVQRLMDETRATEFHSSARSFKKSGMQYKNNHIDIGATMESDEYTQVSVNTDSIQNMAEILHRE